MPRKYVRKGEKGRWTNQQLQGAIKAVVEQGLSINAASKKFGIPKTTLYNHCTGNFQIYYCSKKLIIIMELIQLRQASAEL